MRADDEGTIPRAARNETSLSCWAAANLMSLGYNELRKVAAARTAAEAPGEGVTCRREIRANSIFRVLQPRPAVVTLL